MNVHLLQLSPIWFPPQVAEISSNDLPDFCWSPEPPTSTLGEAGLMGNSDLTLQQHRPSSHQSNPLVGGLPANDLLSPSTTSQTQMLVQSPFSHLPAANPVTAPSPVQLVPSPMAPLAQSPALAQSPMPHHPAPNQATPRYLHYAFILVILEFVHTIS